MSLAVHNLWPLDLQRPRCPVPIPSSAKNTQDDVKLAAFISSDTRDVQGKNAISKVMPYYICFNQITSPTLSKKLFCSEWQMSPDPPVWKIPWEQIFSGSPTHPIITQSIWLPGNSTRKHNVVCIHNDSQFLAQTVIEFPTTSHCEVYF